MNTSDISIDCESLGTAFDAPIVAIGAVVFDRTTGKLGATYYKEVELKSSINSGRVDPDALRWWISQSPRAKAIFGRNADQQSLATVLQDFSTWCRGISGGVPRVWARGPTADVTWLEHAYTVGGHGLAIPWHFRNIRCVRTIVELAEEITGFDMKSVPDVGEAHNAVDDATFQAQVVSASYAALRALKPLSVKTNKAGQVRIEGKFDQRIKPTEDDEL